MKRLFTSLVALATIALSANAQSEYMMRVTKANGSVVSVSAADVEQVTFQTPDALDKVKQHVKTQLQGMAQNLDFSAFSVAAQSLQQFNDDVLLSGKYDQQMLQVAMSIIAKVVPLLQPQDAPAALAAQGITKIIPIDLSVLSGTITIVDGTMTYEPGTEGLIIKYTKELAGQKITNTVTFKGSGTDRYQVIVPIPENVKIESIPAGTALILGVAKQFDFTFDTDAFGGTVSRPLAAKFTLDIQSQSPYIAGLNNAFATTGELVANIPSQTGQATPKKLTFGTSIDPNTNAASSNFQFLIGEQPVATFNTSGNLNPARKIDFSKFNIATFDLQSFIDEMLTNSASSTEFNLLGDLAASIKILDGKAALQYTIASNQARHANDKATLEGLAEQLNQVVTATFTCKGAGIVDAPVKFKTVQFGVDLVNMPCIDLEGNGTYIPIINFYDMESLVYAINVSRHAMEPMGDAVKITGQLVKFAQKVIGLVQSLTNTSQNAGQ